MDLQEILSELGEEKAAVVNAAIQAEKERGITESRKKGKEVLDKVTALNKYRDLLKEIELDPDSDLDTQVKTLKEKLQKSGSTPNDEIEKLRRDFKTLQSVVETERKEKEEATAKYRTSKLSEILSQSMGENFLGKDLIIKDFIRENKVKLIDDKTAVYIDGEDEIDLSKGLESFKQSRPDLVKNIQNGGSGGNSKTNKNTAGKEVMKRADWDNLQRTNPKAAASFALTGSIQD